MVLLAAVLAYLEKEQAEPMEPWELVLVAVAVQMEIALNLALVKVVYMAAVVLIMAETVRFALFGLALVE